MCCGQQLKLDKRQAQGQCGCALHSPENPCQDTNVTTRQGYFAMLLLERASPNALYPGHGQNQNHGFSFLVSISLLLPLSKEKVALASGKSGFCFWFGKKWFLFLVSILPKRRCWGTFASFILISSSFSQTYPKDPAVLKILRRSIFTRRSKFTIA